MKSESTESIRADIVEEARRVAGEAEKKNVTLRLLGGVAIKLRAPDGLHPAFRREYADLDWIVPKGKSAEAQRFFESLGYVPQTRFNALYGRERLLYFDEEHGRQVDVLVGSFKMSHEIPLGERLWLEPLTIPLAELLLTKLQIIELNEKDVRDALAILHDHPVEDDDGDAVNAAQIAKLCASDWGLWRTFTANLEALRGHLDRYDLPAEGKGRIAERVGLLLERIEREPKSFGWKMRAKIGDRKRWYELPEEVDGGP
ncbi:MAG: nucleotidyltransferase family protein [Actinomycetota bacterium]|nr:nucleotidyltransferase family protein [Actinomycetota bacterium]